MEFLKLLIPASISCSCNALANMFWKIHFDKKPLSIKSLNDILMLIRAIPILAGLCCYGISMLIFFYMLSNFKLSAIMPVTCLTYVLNILVAYFVFNERISKMQVIGTVIIIIGLMVLSREGIKN